MLDGNTPSHDRSIRRASTIFLAAVVGVNLAYWGWRWATHETYESCLKDAARAAGGVARAYADLREICEERETARLLQSMPAVEPLNSLFDDLPMSSPQQRQKPAAQRELTDAEVFPSSSAGGPGAGSDTRP